MVFVTLQSSGSGGITPLLAFLFIGASSMWFGLHAFQKLRSNIIETQDYLWKYLVACGFMGTLYGIYGVVEVVTQTLMVEVFRGLMLLLIILFLTLGIREIYYTSAYLSTNGGTRTVNRSRNRRTQRLLIYLVMAVGTVGFVSGSTEIVRLLEFVGVLLSVYGINLARKSLLAKGTVIYTILRHLLPVLACSGMIAALDMLSFLINEFGISISVIDQTEYFLTVVVASFLLMSTVKIQENIR